MEWEKHAGYKKWNGKRTWVKKNGMGKVYRLKNEMGKAQRLKKWDRKRIQVKE